MKLNLLPTYVSKEKSAKTGIFMGALLERSGIAEDRHETPLMVASASSDASLVRRPVPITYLLSRSRRPAGEPFSECRSGRPRTPPHGRRLLACESSSTGLR